MSDTVDLERVSVWGSKTLAEQERGEYVLQLSELSDGTSEVELQYRAFPQLGIDREDGVKIFKTLEEAIAFYEGINTLTNARKKMKEA